MLHTAYNSPHPYALHPTPPRCGLRSVHSEGLRGGCKDHMYHNNRHNYTPYTPYTHIYSYDAYIFDRRARWWRYLLCSPVLERSSTRAPTRAYWSTTASEQRGAIWYVICSMSYAILHPLNYARLYKIWSYHIHTNTHTYTHTHIYTHTYTHTHTHIHTHIHTYTHIHTHIHTYTHIHTHTHTHIYTHTYTHTHIHTYTHTHTHIHTHTHTYTYTHTHTHIHTHTYTHTYTHIHTGTTPPELRTHHQPPQTGMCLYMCVYVYMSMLYTPWTTHPSSTTHHHLHR
jgi:hypothetical protein